MARSQGKKHQIPPADPSRHRVVVCRGGDCGDRRKHPGIDHRAQLERFVSGLGDDIPVIPARCLEACENSNVVVVLPASGPSRYAPEPTWIGEVLEEQTVEEIISWVRDDGAAAAEMPVSVEVARFAPSRLNRTELDKLLAKKRR